MRVKPTKRNIVFAITIVVVLIGVIIVLRSKFTAEERGDIVPSAISQLTISISESGKGAVGVLHLDSDCPKKALPSQGGMFRCKLISTNRDHNEILSLSFQSFVSDRYYPIALQSRTVEPQPIKIKAGSNIFLQVKISDEGNVEVWEMTSNGITLVDPQVGLTNI